MKIKPIGKRILVETIHLEEKTNTGIILIQNNDEQTYKIGKIISISDNEEIKSLFAINDTIIFSKKAGTKIQNSIVNQILLELDEVLGKIEN